MILIDSNIPIYLVGPEHSDGYNDRIRRVASENANQLSARGEEFE